MFKLNKTVKEHLSTRKTFEKKSKIGNQPNYTSTLFVKKYAGT